MIKHYPAKLMPFEFSAVIMAAEIYAMLLEYLFIFDLLLFIKISLISIQEKQLKLE